MYVSTKKQNKKCQRLPERVELFLPTQTPNLSGSGSGSSGTCESWMGKRKSGTTETPADKRAHKSALTGIVYPSAVLFHRHGSEVALLSTECGFLWDVRVCERQIRSYYPGLAVPPDYLRAPCRRHISHWGACRPLISYRESLSASPTAWRAQMSRKERGGGCERRSLERGPHLSVNTGGGLCHT